MKEVIQVKRNALKISVCLVLTLALTSVCFAATESKVIDVKAYVPQQSGLVVSVSKVVGSTWTTGQTNMDFGSLVFDLQNNIFVGTSYYAVDIGVNSNAASWQIKHETTPIANGADTLDENINVTFMKQLDKTNAEEILKVNYSESNGRTFYKNDLTGGWLRIYYGLATGEAGEDAANAKPISATKTFGNYQGTVKITLTEN